jgi:hypothetical protein
MKKYIKSLFPFLLISFALLATSCKKKCVMDANNEDKGWIEENVIFYNGVNCYLTNQLKGNYVITATSPIANQINVSIDGGSVKPVDYSNYTVLCYPILSHCNAQFVRDVSFNSVTQSVEYSITVTQCAKCEEERFTENFVLVPKFPSNYNVTYNISYVNLE